MILGKSPAMKVIHTTIHQLNNNSERTILIVDETGVDKDLVAQAIHFGGARASKPYVPVNCSATPATLSGNPIFFAMFKMPSPERRKIIKWTDGSKAAAAHLLNIPRRTLYRKLAKYNL